MRLFMGKAVTTNRLIKVADDLITSRQDTRAGFISMALEKNSLAIPYIEEARVLKVLANRCTVPKDLLSVVEIRNSLVAASGLSTKSLAYMNETDINVAISGLIEEFLEPAGVAFVDELVYRYLLIKGDALGGQARNLAGALGERKLLRCLLSVLAILGVNYKWLDKEDKKWKSPPITELTLERRIKAISWTANNRARTIALNINVPLVNKNVDLCLLEGKGEELHLSGTFSKSSIHKDISKYISLGELKGGIDPAGADEHWKTANTALSRIRNSFKSTDLDISTFFVGAAIENSMAQEIFDQLTTNTLTNAANLHNEEQLVELCMWLVKS